ncbi:MAG TPA: NAD(P)/FAD-dependent oxidoreductase [Nocardioidaceae bacterium]|nr:NAD(P)/FAD-dependent oxidoreductase [Nocardioidaceae bacterium]
MTSGSKLRKYDVVIVGGGHNGLVSAAYLAKAGLSVLLLERLDNTGGAAISAEAFSGLDARLSRYSYLVSLLPEQIIKDLDLDLELKSRRTASYTPVVRDGKHTGLLVERPEGTLTAESFRALTGSDEEYDTWRSFYGDVTDFAQAVAPTLLEPLRTEKEMRELVDAETWGALVSNPLGKVIEERFRDDTVRGVVATDALIGTFAGMNDASLVQNRCFLYHVVGNGTGEWRVPVGGMGAVTDALADAARRAGAEIITGAGVSRIDADGTAADILWHDGQLTHTVEARWVLSNVAPWVLQILLGEEPGEPPVGSQLKVNFLLDRLPRLKSGADPEVAFDGTFHVAEDYTQLETAFEEASSGKIPTTPPGELYCHSLTDPSILGSLAGSGKQTLTYFGVHMPSQLFEDDHDARRDEAVERVLDAINEHLEEPIESCLATDSHGRPCLEAKTPQDIDNALAMPGGHIFHGDLSWPWAPNRARMDTPAHRWGVATDVENVLLCGSGARRGGAVSGIAGHNAAMAVLEAHKEG